jgi:hypothetical protein
MALLLIYYNTYFLFLLSDVRYVKPNILILTLKAGHNYYHLWKNGDQDALKSSLPYLKHAHSL